LFAEGEHAARLIASMMTALTALDIRHSDGSGPAFSRAASPVRLSAVFYDRARPAIVWSRIVNRRQFAGNRSAVLFPLSHRGLMV
jgi:hypothetical protein